MRTARGLATALLTTAIVTGAAGCRPGAGTTAEPAAGATATETGVLRDGGRLARSEGAAAAASSAMVTLDFTVDGRPLTGEVLTDTTGRCLGRLASGAGRAEVLAADETVWIRPDAAFAADWFAPGPAGQPAVGRYLQFKGGKAPEALAGACAAFPANVQVAQALLLGVTETGRRTVGSREATVYAARLRTGVTEFAVAADGAPLLVQLVRTEGPARGSYTFDYYSSKVDVPMPPGGEVSDGLPYLKG
ncbi:hypothetical protein ACIRBX_29750 [Kitasatospora sp. NPDC096147]|uniref:hypothetical protein n=1 Tax=Kitasatospora sp. NPDC096147 TaxID=3364093 RepID=UPI00380C1B04